MSAVRILAIDFGDRRVGLAATDYTGTIRVPLPALVGLDDDACARAVGEVADERDSEVIVVGMPLRADGYAGERARRTEAFVDRLRQLVQRRIETIDESLSTDEAHDLLKQAGVRAARRRGRVDSMAACVILERFQHQQRQRRG